MRQFECIIYEDPSAPTNERSVVETTFGTFAAASISEAITAAVNAANTNLGGTWEPIVKLSS